MKFLLVLLFISCASQQPKKALKKTYNHVASPGQVTYIEIPTDIKNLGMLSCSGKKINYFRKNDSVAFYFAEGYWSQKKKRKCIFSQNKDIKIAIKIIPYKYPSERLKVDKKRVFLSKKDQARAARERKITKKVYRAFLKSPLFDGPFVEPLNSHKTSIYGTKRIFNKKKNSTHLGTDYRARTPIKIPAANKGKVVLAQNLFYAGNSVILDHGGKIFTLYGHLSKIKVKVGDTINQGDTVGLSGATGRVSGPHLHWGVKVQGENISGISLVSESMKEFAND